MAFQTAEVSTRYMSRIIGQVCYQSTSIENWRKTSGSKLNLHSPSLLFCCSHHLARLTIRITWFLVAFRCALKRADMSVSSLYDSYLIFVTLLISLTISGRAASPSSGVTIDIPSLSARLHLLILFVLVILFEKWCLQMKASFKSSLR